MNAFLKIDRRRIARQGCSEGRSQYNRCNIKVATIAACVNHVRCAISDVLKITVTALTNMLFI